MSDDPKVKVRPQYVYIWRSRARGFVVVVAADLEDARVAAVGQYPNMQQFMTREPDEVLRAQPGTVAYLPQRG